MARILVIEDETFLRDGVCRGLAKAGHDVEGVDNLDEALRRVDSQVPDLVLSDIDLPGRSGLELIGELGRRNLRIPVIYVSGYLNAYRAQIPQHAGVQVLEKPVSIEDLREKVRRTLSGSRANVELTPFTLVDFLQLACIGKHSVRLAVQRNGAELGVVVVESGQLWSARDASGTGEPAFGRLAFAEGSQTRVERLEADAGARNIMCSWEFAVMEAARLRDESGGFRSEPPSIRLGEWEGPVASPESRGPPPTDAANPMTRAFNSAFERGVDALLAKNYMQALEAFLDAAGYCPNEPKVVANIRRLKDMGYELCPDETAKPAEIPKEGS